MTLNWLAYPLFCCGCVFISVCNDIVFLTREQIVLQMDLWRITWAK